MKNVSTLLYAIFKELTRIAGKWILLGGRPFDQQPTLILVNGGLVGVPGIEPGTSSLSGTRSNQLSYTPLKAIPKIETRKPFRSSIPSLGRKWRQPGLNR